jgi:hypothetical protein
MSLYEVLMGSRVGWDEIEAAIVEGCGLLE